VSFNENESNVIKAKRTQFIVGTINIFVFTNFPITAQVIISNLHGNTAFATFNVAVTESDCHLPLVSLELAQNDKNFSWSAISSQVTMTNIPELVEIRIVALCRHSRYALTSVPFWFTGTHFTMERATHLTFVRESAKVIRFNESTLLNPDYRSNPHHHFAVLGMAAQILLY